MKAYVLALALAPCLSIAALSQSTASCTFSYFVPPAPYNVSFQANGINHYGTVVGSASTNTVTKALVKPSGQSAYFFGMPNATNTTLNKRNLYGTSVGFYAASAGASGLIYTSSSHATLNYPNAYSTVLWGINKYNSMVGAYAASYGSDQQGFKYKGGTFTSIRYPNSAQTVPRAINDSGTIVGEYVNVNLEHPPHGFVYSNGTYKTLDVPGGISTELLDINNAGTIVAGPNLLYKNGAWEKVVAPNAAETFVNGINDLGTVTGLANYPASGGNYTWKAFVAACK